jgi:hypothetical protein
MTTALYMRERRKRLKPPEQTGGWTDSQWESVLEKIYASLPGYHREATPEGDKNAERRKQAHRRALHRAAYLLRGHRVKPQGNMKKAQA